MEWIHFRTSFPEDGKQTLLLTDGVDIYVGYVHDKEIRFITIVEDEDDLREVITHWGLLNSVKLPRKYKRFKGLQNDKDYLRELEKELENDAS